MSANSCIPFLHTWSKYSEAHTENGNLYQFRYCERCNAYQKRLSVYSFAHWFYADQVNKLIAKRKEQP